METLIEIKRKRRLVIGQENLENDRQSTVKMTQMQITVAEVTLTTITGKIKMWEVEIRLRRDVSLLTGGVRARNELVMLNEQVQQR